MRTIRLHDTLRGSVVPLEPREPGRVGIYACGPTVYGRVHVGNARPFVVFALLARFLEHEGYETRFVANITDVNDKIYDAARERGVASAELAREMTDAYIADTNGLGLGRPDAEPRATETIGPIVELIGDLVESGHAYEAGGDVYYLVTSFDGYGAWVKSRNWVQYVLSRPMVAEPSSVMEYSTGSTPQGSGTRSPL